MPLHPGRRASDGTPDLPRAVAWLRAARDWAPAVIGLAALIGAHVTTPGERLADIEHEQAVDRVRDSLSIADRTAFAEALSTLGRIQCRTLGADKTTDFGVPCRLLLDGGRWPLMHGAARAIGASAPPTLPVAPVTTPAVAMTALLIPVAVVRRDGTP